MTEEIQYVRIKLAFSPKQKDSTFIQKLICLWTRSQYHHVEVIVDDEWLSANDRDKVYIRELKPLNSKWTYIDLGEIAMTTSQVQRLKIWMREQHGKRYDMFGILFSQIFPFKMHHRSKWFCSEISAAVLKIANEPHSYGLVPEELSPGDLYRWYSEIFPNSITLYNHVELEEDPHERNAI